ncbi:MAG: Crp/Fnr family transcriptional regulator [Rhodospirillales bacterium]|nr:Crp/Fnr family transcriptional regulator [Alphaproteobacteria bacterium]USO06462.1 MAG: Crp/Fnr family transcriptional regulator [Rhodospirillales bacterium]
MGDKAEGFFIILKGWVKLYRVSKTGEEAIVHVIGPGESFAEAAVFNDGRTYPVNAQAVEDVDLIEVPRSFFVQKIQKDSSFALCILGAIASRQHHLIQQLEQVTTRTASQRVGAFLLRFCQKEEGEGGTYIVMLPYDKALISARLNIKPETFSRALRKLTPHGIHLGEENIIITDMDSLRDFCDVPLVEKPC